MTAPAAPTRHAARLPTVGMLRWPYRVLTIDSPSCRLTTLPATELLQHGIDLRPFSEATGALLGLEAEDPAAVLAPTDLEGVEFLTFVRAVVHWCDAAVLVGLTGQPDSHALAVQALDAGARGLLGLPFQPLQLASALHHLGLQPSSGAAPLRHGPVTVDRAAHLVTVAGTRLPVSPKELLLLECLLVAAPRPVPAAEVAAALDFDPSHAKTVVVYVRRVRLKLAGLHPDRPPCRIENVRGLGYRLVVDPEPE